MAARDALLHARWRAATTALCDCDATAADDALESVLARHRSTERHYHDELHVARVVDAVHELTDGSPDVHAFVLAAVFHDAVHDPQSTTNEADSADLAARTLGELGAQKATISRVRDLILATAHHFDGTDIDPTTEALLDADLSVLGGDPLAYQSYVEGVRLEYVHLDDASWTEGRRRVVDALLARDPIFRTAEGRRQWEARARANLTAERRSLSQQA
jgi:predicted metal-dependent HD superfamily phosphohydrolase